MKAVILAGGLGTRLAEETGTKPKPMVEIGGQPILWHVMKIYSAHGINEFIICLGYKGYVIKEYFANYALHMSDVTIDMRSGVTTVHENKAEPWKITLVETGEKTQIGGRIKRVIPYIEEDTFCLTYGDGVGDVAIDQVIALHQPSKRLYVGMHDAGRDGSHKRPAKEIWVYDLASRKRLQRAPGSNSIAMALSKEAEPKLFMVPRPRHRPHGQARRPKRLRRHVQIGPLAPLG